MTARKTYLSKLDRLNWEAKQETFQMLKNYGIKELDLRGSGVYVFEKYDNYTDNFREFPVTKVVIIDGVDGETIGWDCEGPSPWFYNPTLWMEICSAVAAKFGKRI